LSDHVVDISKPTAATIYYNFL